MSNRISIYGINIIQYFIFLIRIKLIVLNDRNPAILYKINNFFFKII